LVRADSITRWSIWQLDFTYSFEMALARLAQKVIFIHIRTGSGSDRIHREK